MARAEIPYVVYKGQNPVQVASGASVNVNIRGGGPATVYAAETGGGTAANPITTDAYGRIEGWVDEGSYDLTVSGSGITTYTQPIELSRGDGVGRLAANAVTQPAILNGAVSFAKLGSDVISNIIPPGVIWPWAGGAAPPTWSLCDGGSLDGTLAVNTPLWNAINTTYGGTGQSNFFKPDLRGRTIVGADNMGTAPGSANRLTTFNARGDGGGFEVISLTIAHLPAHNHGITDPGHNHATSESNHAHGISDPGHSHGQNRKDAPGTTGGVWRGNTGGGVVDTTSDIIASGTGISIAGALTGLTINNNSTGITITNTGGGAAHPNMQPYQILHYIIKL